MREQSRDQYQAIAERLLSANHVVVSTGAGVSKESGVPTFREADGLWSKFRPEELANVDAFIRNPERVWEWYQWRRDLISKVKPNPGHYALVELDTLLNRFTLITQNVDNLHQVAGNEYVVELHGNIQRNKCHKCSKFFEEGSIVFEQGSLPKCDCGGLIRPDVVWFGEMLPEDAIQTAWIAAESCDIFLSIGTSAVVYPAAQLPYIAKDAGAFLVEINPEVTELSPLTDISIREASGVALPKIVAALKDL
ncbi:NAD-dependent deacylase [bacterium]|nr:NAD-dependent deacylase [bacterium]